MGKKNKEKYITLRTMPGPPPKGMGSMGDPTNMKCATKMEKAPKLGRPPERTGRSLARLLLPMNEGSKRPQPQKVGQT